MYGVRFESACGAVLKRSTDGGMLRSTRKQIRAALGGSCVGMDRQPCWDRHAARL